jgi:hypothetical protein
VQRAVPPLSLGQRKALFAESSCIIRLLAPPPSLANSKHPALIASCPFLFLVYYSGFFFFFGGVGVSLQGALLFYPRGDCGNTVCHLFAHLLVCVSQTGLELASGGMGGLLFSHCNVVWRIFVWARDSGCQNFAYSSFFFFCQLWLQCLSKIFDLWSSCCLLPPSNHHIGSFYQHFQVGETFTLAKIRLYC